MFTSRFLDDVRRKALRKRVWYRALDRLERGIFSLATQLIDEVKSELLGVELVKMLRKLSDAMKSGFARCVEEYGLRKAKAIALQAVRFGYESAGEWASDVGFIRYLAFLKVNELPGWTL
jgi:hypothetical protein